MSAFDTPLLLTPAETAKALKMSKTKLYGLWKSRPEAAPPSFMIGNNRYVSVDDLRAFIASRPHDESLKVN